MSKESKTLFIRNLPFSTAKETLEDTFSEFGPIKQCFIVTDRGTGKSKGFGYVQFTLREDAVKAKDAVKHIDGRAVYVDFADISRKKTKREKLEDRLRRKQETQEEGSQNRTDHGDDEMDADDDESNDGDDAEADEVEEQQQDGEDNQETFTNKSPVRERQHFVKDSSPKKADLKYHRAKIVVLTGLPEEATQEDVEKCLQKLKVKHVAEVKFTGDQIQVKFRSIREAKNGIRKLNGKSYKGHELTAVQLSEISVNVPESVLKRSRLIVRNLSFKCNEDELRKAFESCDGLMDVTIPIKSDGRKFGFGFVQFNSLRHALKAVEQMNGTEILGRPVAVDWVLPKDKYEANQSNKNDSRQSVGNQGDKTQFSGKRKVFTDSNDEEESSDDDDDGEADNDDQLIESDNDRDDDRDEDSGDSDSGVHSEIGDSKKKKIKDKQKSGKPSDVDQGKTVFIRNLSFDSTEEGLEEHFSQFGDLVYCKVVVDPQTEHSKGMGFVKFKSKESAEKCLQEAESSGIILDSRQLILSLAVSREQSSKFNEKKKKEKKDNRNLYLAREGMIRPGTQAAEGLSKVDLDKRMKVEAVKRQKLKNDNIFISPYRLCVRNLPPAVDDKQLKKIYLKAAGDNTAEITECRVMRDFKRSTGKGEGKSLGYGFVCFKEHQHALAGLRHTNNNPEIFGENKRLIVEFSLENKKALEAKQRRIEKQKMKQEAQKLKSDESSTTPKTTKPGKASKVELLTLSEKDKKLKGDNPKGLKGLPSHWGPKIRHKQRQGQKVMKKKGQKGKMGKEQPKEKLVKKEGKRNLENADGGPEKKRRKRNKYKDTADSFDTMVNKYKQKITGAKANKWFD